MERKLIYTDTNLIAGLKKDVARVCEASNNLIEVFNNFQTFEVITDPEQFMELCRDPKAYFDRAITENIEVKATGNLKIDPARGASLFGIHRSEYLNLVSGLSIPDEGGCKPCGRVKIKRGRRAISLYEFTQYQKYLFFEAGSFKVLEDVVEGDTGKYSIYAEPGPELEGVELFNELVAILNSFDGLYGLPSNIKKDVANALHLHLERGMEGSFMLNSEYLKNEVLRIRNTK